MVTLNPSWMAPRRKRQRPESACRQEAGWRHPLDAAGRVPLSFRMRRGLLALLLLCAASGVFASVLLWFQPPPPVRLILIGSGYEDDFNVPPHAAGRRALEQFAYLASRSASWSQLFTRSGHLRLDDGVTEFRAGDDWFGSWDRYTEPNLIVFLTVHAGMDEEGPYLLPAESGFEAQWRVRFDHLLDRLAALPASRKKLVILDCARLEAHWALGMLHNDFVRGVTSLEPRIAAIPNLVVMLSADVDQNSWDRGLGESSVFSHFLMQCLVEGPDSGRGPAFTAWDLYLDVRDAVSNWTTAYRGSDQRPLLLPREDGERRARAIPLVLRLESLPPVERYDPLLEIEAAWKRYERVRREAPAAVMSSPQLWRIFEAGLLRSEQLRLTGGGGAAEVIRDQALSVEDELWQRQVLPLQSALATLTMPALTGEVFPGEAAANPLLDQLWAASRDERTAVWVKLQQSPDFGPAAPAAARRRLLKGLVSRAAEDPARNLAWAAELVNLVHDPSQGVVPAEAHFLSMLQRDLPPPLSDRRAQLVGKVLRVRVLAEQAALGVEPDTAPCAEYLLPWIADAVVAADRERRLGEDLVFATDDDDLTQAAQRMEQAEQRYRQILADASTVRVALQQRNAAMSELPYLARWVSRIHTPQLEEASAEIVALWNLVHQLATLLRGEPCRSRLEALRSGSAQVQSGLARLHARLEQSARTAADVGAPDRETLRAVLEVPCLPLPLRMTVLRTWVRLERQALDGVAVPGAGSATHFVGAEQIRLRGQLRGAMAMAALGERSFRSLSVPQQASYEHVQERLKALPDDESWRTTLLQLGSEIGSRWQRLAGEPERLVAAACQEQVPERVRPILWEADEWVRFSPAVTARATAPRMLRCSLVADALVLQARRTEEDHWAEQHPDAVPYYQTAATTLLRDARLISPTEALLPSGVDELETRLQGVDNLELQVTARVDLTPGERVRLTVALPQDLRPGRTGFPLIWRALSPAHDQGALDIPLIAPEQRRVVSSNGETASSAMSVAVASPLLERWENDPPPRTTPQQVDVVWAALHRGFRTQRTTQVMLHPQAAVVCGELPPRQAAVAVAADPLLLRRLGRAQGALAIVLDCSGSMGTVSTQPTPEPTRFQLVSRAFRELLENVLPGTTVSLWVFGQAIGDQRTADVAEATVQRLQDPIAWTGEPSQVRELMARVERLVPWNESPILRAMLTARQDLLRAEGFRTMVVLTDGIDNRFAHDRELNPNGETVPDALRRRFQGTGIKLQVIGFQVANHEDDEAHRQFSPVFELDPPGSFCTVDDPESLVASVRGAGRSALQYSLTGSDDSALALRPNALTGEVLADDGPVSWLPVPLRGRTRSWDVTLTPGLPVPQTLALSPGDALSLRLVQRESQWGLQRMLFAPRIDLPGGRLLQSGGWTAAIPHFARAAGGNAQLLLTLEPPVRESEPVVRVVRPAAIWLEMTAGDGQLLDTHMRPLAGYPAPAWRIDVPAWPLGHDQQPLAGVMRVWWLADQPALPCVTLRRGVDFATPENLPRRVPAAGGDVVIESVRVESRHLVAGRVSSRSATDAAWCVAVRVTHPAGQPVRAELEGLGTMQVEEHRYYRGAGKYVALIQPVGWMTETELVEHVADNLQALHLVSISALCQQAASEDHRVEFTSLGSPGDSGSVLSQPVPLE